MAFNPIEQEDDFFTRRLEMSEQQKQYDAEVELAKPEVDEPRLYEVVLLNDDYTTMDFVIEVLMRFFKKDAEEAAAIMLAVHQKGSAVAGIYPLDIAEMRKEQVIDYARTHGHPLMLTLRPH